jgi:hypothetical protein
VYKIKKLKQAIWIASCNRSELCNLYTLIENANDELDAYSIVKKYWGDELENKNDVQFELMRSLLVEVLEI